jgi:hypothetical protein
MLRAGAILLPMGLLAIVLGWYGTANTPYEYDQISYLVSGGLLGLGLVLVGGFLLFGAWLAQISEQGRQSSARLAEALEALVSAQAAASGGASEQVRMVTAGKGSTLHRSDCGLVADRPDLVAVGAGTGGLTPCRVCAPLDPAVG